MKLTVGMKVQRHTDGTKHIKVGDILTVKSIEVGNIVTFEEVKGAYGGCRFKPVRTEFKAGETVEAQFSKGDWGEVKFIGMDKNLYVCKVLKTRPVFQVFCNIRPIQKFTVTVDKKVYHVKESDKAKLIGFLTSVTK